MGNAMCLKLMGRYRDVPLQGGMKWYGEAVIERVAGDLGFVGGDGAR